jgi:hypothetical protein
VLGPGMFEHELLVHEPKRCACRVHLMIQRGAQANVFPQSERFVEKSVSLRPSECGPAWAAANESAQGKAR